MIDKTSGIRPTAIEILHEQFNEMPADTKRRWRSWWTKTRERQPVVLKRLPARWRIFHSFWLLLNNPPTPTPFSLYHSLPPTHSAKLLPLAATQRGSIAVDTTAAAAAAAQLCSHQGDSSSLPGAALHWGTFQWRGRGVLRRTGQTFKTSVALLIESHHILQHWLSWFLWSKNIFVYWLQLRNVNL